jgi:hypothetical protein
MFPFEIGLWIGYTFALLYTFLPLHICNLVNNTIKKLKNELSYPRKLSGPMSRVSNVSRVSMLELPVSSPESEEAQSESESRSSMLPAHTHTSAHGPNIYKDTKP